MLAPQTNIHDAFFKQIMSEQGIADTLLREHLPREIANLLTAEPPDQRPGSFVDEELAQHHSDMLFRVHLATGNDALAYLLVGHKSTPDRAARLQLLRYIRRALRRWNKEHETLPLPPIVPILVSQSPEGWTLS